MRSALVVGAGHIGRRHLACLGSLSGVSIEAVCDVSAATAEMVAERYGARRSFTELEAALAACSPDVVHVATPVESHVPLAEACLAAGAHVIVEKPAAPTFEQVKSLLGAAERAGRRLIEDYNYVFDPRVQRVLAMVAGGELGELLHVEVGFALDLTGAAGAVGATSREDAPVPPGAAADILPHLCSLAHAFVGPHREVDAAWRLQAGAPVDLRALLEAERGSAVLGFSARAQPDRFSLLIEGTRGRVEVGLFEPRIVVQRTRSGPRPLTPLANGLAAAVAELSGAGRGLRRKLSGGAGSYEGLWQLVGGFYDALERDAPSPLSPADVLAVNAAARDILGSLP